MFVTSRNLFVWCISAKTNNYNLTKNSRKFQASVTETCTFSVSAKSFKSTCEIVESATHDFQVTFKVSSRIFLHLFIHALTSCLCLIAHILCILFAFIFVKGITFRFYYSWDGKRKKNKSYILDYIYRFIWLIYLILWYSINLFNYFLYICYLLPLSFI